MKLAWVFLALSLLLNFVLAGGCIYLIVKGTPEINDGRYGVLKQSIEIGRFGETARILSLPKGLMVQDASSTGADWFEPHRFRIVVTSDRENLVDYSIDQNAAQAGHGELYSADIRK